MTFPLFKGDFHVENEMVPKIRSFSQTSADQPANYVGKTMGRGQGVEG